MLGPFAGSQIQDADTHTGPAVRGNNKARAESVLGCLRHHALLAATRELDVGREDRARVFERVVNKRVDRVPLVLVIEVAPLWNAAYEVTVVLPRSGLEERAEDK